MRKSILLLVLGCFLVPLLAWSDVEHKLFRKVAVFPIFDANYSTAEDAWWQMRETLTKDKKLLIAAKRFMINRGVFQPRRALKPADAIILGRLLDAEAIVVTYVEDRTVRVKVYDAESGYILWEEDAQFHPAVPVNDQLIKVTSKMMSDFIDGIPYQAFTEKDESTEKYLFESAGKKFARIFVGGAETAQIGDLVQWISVSGDPSLPLFQNARIKILADGVIQEVTGDHALVELKEAADLDHITADSLVRFPRDMSKSKDLLVNEKGVNVWDGNYLKEGLKPVREFNKETHPAATGIAMFVNIVLFVLLAF